MMSEKKKSSVIIKAVFLIVFAALIGIAIVLFMEYSRSTTQGKEIEMEIPEGSSTKDIVRLLKENGVIRFQIPFYIRLYQSESRGKLRYGSYTLNDGMSLNDIIDALSRGGKESSSQIRFTVPEGYTVKKIGAKLEEEDIVKAEDFYQAVKDAAKDFPYAKELPEADSVFYQLEGYLFPDTYFLEEDMTADEILAMMLDEFQNKMDADHVKKAEEMGMTVTELLVRASLVEKETELLEEYPVIAGVINNRLAANMKLQFDSTVVYAMTEGDYGVKRVLYSDLKYDSPYNTYMYEGLPVGPIGNPGLEAIDAVLNPADHEYLFFQTDTVKNDGSNLFFKTYEEHEAAYSTRNQGEETTGAAEEKTTESAEKATESTEKATESTENTTKSTEKTTDSTEKKTTKKSTTEAKK